MPVQQVPNSDLAPDTARRNLLTNGGFEIWQRGAGSFTLAGAYTADRWVNYAPSGTISVARNTANADGGVGACAAVSTTAPGAAGNGVYQIIDCTTDFSQLRGRTLTVSVRVACAQANSVRLELVGDKAVSLPHTTVSAYHSGAGAYETLTATITLGASVTGLTIWVTGLIAGTWFVDNAMLVEGTVAATYTPLHPAEDLARCLRYYEVLGTFANELAMAGYGGVGSTEQHPIRYKVEKAVAPTVTKVGTWVVGNCGQATIGAGGATGGFFFSLTVTALGAWLTANDGAGKNVTSEANP